MRASTYALQFLSVIGIAVGLTLFVLTLGLPKPRPGLLAAQAACIITCIIVFFMNGNIRRRL